MSKIDVVIVGAGAAGLACASRLAESGVSFVLLEARNRIGGRVLTKTRGPHQAPIELGAEFLHGYSKNLFGHLQKNKISFLDVSDGHLFSKSKLQERHHFWEELEKIDKKLNPRRSKDRSVHEFLLAHKGAFPKQSLSLYKSYIEGFQAADLQLIGERALAREESPDPGALNEVKSFRPLGGYSHVLTAYTKNRILKKALKFECITKEILWQKKS